MGLGDLEGAHSATRLIRQDTSESDWKAAVVVAGRAVDADDAAELLAMLGLLDVSEGLQHDQLAPARLAHAVLRARRSTARSGARSAVGTSGGTDA